ncbi:MAG: ABC transporter permease [Bacteroidota bacterium]
MLRLLRIDLLKLANYRAFWVLNILYGLLIIGIPAGVIEFLKWLDRLGADFDNFNPMKIPILHFPDIWQNTTYVYTFLKIFMAIIIVISISNEFSYKTVRQNIIDGMSRLDFLKSKLSTILLMSLASSVLVFITCLITGLIYTPEYDFSEIFDGVEFVGAYFIDLFGFLVFAFLMTVLLKRSALTIFILLIYRMIEAIFIANLPESIDVIGEYFPLQAMSNMIEIPFPKYAFQEIKDYVVMPFVGVSLAWIALFVYAIYAKLKSSDL